MAPGATGPLSPSQEEAYRIKCVELIARMKEVTSENDQLRVRKERLIRGIKKMRLERAVLLEAIKQRMPKDDVDAEEDEDSEDSSDSPPTPQERPLRTKKSHRRLAASPTPAGPGRNKDKDGGSEVTGANTAGEIGGDFEAGATGEGEVQGAKEKSGVYSKSKNNEKEKEKEREKDASITLTGKDDNEAVKPKPDPDAVATGGKGVESGKKEESAAFRAFSSHLLNDVLPTDPHGEAEVKTDFDNDYNEYARKKWGELDDTSRARWEREGEKNTAHAGGGNGSARKGRKKSAGVKENEDTEMADA